jgi:ferredoxin-NADP reductase
MPPNLLPLTISDIREEVHGFRVFRFAERLPYQAGQFLTFVQTIDGLEVRRSYSLLSSPAFDEPLAIGVRRISNGAFSRFLFERVRTGDRLWCTGATGMFRLPDAEAEPQTLFFFAAGSGITPVLSLLRTALATRPAARTILVYSSPDPSVVLFRSELEALAAQYGARFSCHLLFSSSKDLHRARLNRPLLLDLVQQEGALSENSWFYCCGPLNYMRLCTYVLRGQGVAPERIRREDFIPGAPPPPPAVPPEEGPHTVIIDTAAGPRSLQLTWPETILKAALRNGIELPWSCAAGRCGSCTLRCTSGSVWMAQNEVLTPADLQQGLVLTCTGYPVGKDVRLQAPPGV